MGVEATPAAGAAAPAAPPAAPAAGGEPAGGGQPAPAGGEGGGGEGEGGAAPAGAAPAGGEPAAKKPPWFQTRIDQLTREKWEERRAREKAEAERDDAIRKAGGAPAAPAGGEGGGAPAAAPAAPAPAAPAPGVRSDPNDPVVQQAAARIVAEQDFNRRCNEVYTAGTSEFQDFGAAVKNFDMLGGLGSHRQLVEAVTQIDGGHKVLHHLGTNLEEAMRIVQLPPVQMAVELAKLAGTLKAAPKVSQAAAPPAPVNGGGGSPDPKPDDKGEFKSQEDYRAWRKRQFRQR